MNDGLVTKHARSDVQSVLQPLDLEQSLHFLDVLTWFPVDSSDRWDRVARYVNENCPASEPHAPRVYERIVQQLASLVTDSPAYQGRWAAVPEPKLLYQLKYDLKHLLFPDDWFTFMNMGVAAPGIRLKTSTSSVFDDLWQFSRALYDRVASAVELAGHRVLEVGCGRGGGASYIHQKYAPSSLVGLDYSPGNVAFCRRRHQAEGLSFVEGDAEALQFSDDSFDAVMNVESAHCYPDVDRFFNEVRRVLHPAGAFLFADEWWTGAVQELEQRFSRAGLEIEDREDLRSDVVRALELLEELYPRALEAIDDQDHRRVWDHFFRVRVCTNSAASYTTGRFTFLRYVLRPI